MTSVNSAVVIASLVSVGAVLGLQAVQEMLWPPSTSRTAELAPLINANVESIEMLRRQVVELRGQLARTGAPVSRGIVNDGGAESLGLAKRLDEIEHTLAELLASGPVASSRAGGEFEKKLTEVTYLAAAGSSLSHTQSAQAEIDFENDTGVPLGDFEETISDTLYTAEGIDVSGMECRGTICKVTYSQSDSLQARDAGADGFEVVDRLAEATSGREVEVRYGSDPAGKKVMYIQIR
ncbi:MAG: hypothetical protein H6989_02345 [Pseudomonadales bacterium]|nr:hypothetical protein [Pseudomonadales bacterium]